MKFTINGREYPVPEKFNLGDRADMEDIAGQGYDLGKGGPRALLALLFVSIRRIDPSVTLEDLRAIEDEDLTRISDELEAQKEKAEDDARPPAGVPLASDEPPPPSVDASENGSVETSAATHALSGGPTSPTGVT